MAVEPSLHDLLNESPVIVGFNHQMSDFSQFEALLDMLPDPNITVVPVPDYLLAPFTVGHVGDYCQHEFVPTNVEWNAIRSLPPQMVAQGLYSAQLNVMFDFLFPFSYTYRSLFVVVWCRC